MNVEIDQNTAQYKTPYGVIEVASEDFFGQLGGAGQMIPVNLRYHDRLRRLVVLEYPPTYRLIHNRFYDDAMLGKGGGTLRRIPLPWQVYVCDLSGWNMYFYVRGEQLRSLDDMLYHHFVTNVYADGRPCSGTRGDKSEKDDVTAARSMIDGLWQTGFSSFFYANRALKFGTGKSILPKEMLEAGLSKVTYEKRANDRDPYEWLEQFTPAEISNFHFVESATLRDHLDRISATVDVGVRQFFTKRGKAK